jgi:cellulose synthase/poly-beta-1,6-N-acetylglucosamine synthase-like glycosyltransferase
MKELLLWVSFFFALIISIFWIQVIYFKEEKKIMKSFFPKVSILIPAYNEEKTISKTISSILDLDYPKEKIQIIVINDSSTDKTAEVVRHFKKVNLIYNKHQGVGKASALNKGLKYVTGEFIAVVDADSEVDKESLKKLIVCFDDEKVGAVISSIKIKNLKNTYHHIQRLEYILATFLRKLMSKIDTLHITPGVLSVYRTKLIKELGNFDENNITEDLEIALRLRANNYSVKMSHDSITYTNVPSNFKSLWNQRIRWFRGFIYNNNKYRNMFMNKKYGLMGKFQFPLNIISFFTIILLFILISYEIFTNLYEFIFKIILLKGNLFNSFDFRFPTLNEIIINANIRLLFPLFISFLLSFYILKKAHKSMNEKLIFNPALFIYFTVYPLIRTAHWITAFYKEIIKTKRKW